MDALKPNPAMDEYLWDTEAKGFGVRVKSSAARSFVSSYYEPGLHQTRRRLTIGAYGPLTVDEARKKALELLARIANGEDPAMTAADQRRAIRDETVRALFGQYLTDGIDIRRPRTLKNYETIGRLHILPASGHLPVARVSSKEVTALHRSMRANPTNANRVLQLLKAFFYWLERQGFFSGENPARKTERDPEEVRERFLTVEETARLGDALRVAENQGREPAP